MSKKHIVVEKGTILCEHGAEVELVSSVPVHVIGGEKPLYTTDFLGAVVKGCGYLSSVGGQCKQVAVITSSITESNVSNKGKNYLLRVDGCQTDNGSSLVLVDPGQTNSVVPVKQSGASNAAVIKALEDAKVNTEENILKEKYRIYPLRQSNDEVRGLRGLRDFRVMKNYHYSNDYTHERIVPKTEAYLYMTIDGITKEYEVINRGDYFRPQISQVYFKDEDKILRRYLPVYEEGKKPELVYSNIKLEKPYADVSKLTKKVVDFTDKTLSYTTHHKVFSKAVSYEQEQFESEKLISLEEAKKLNKKYLNVVVHLEDPIGEVEDLYHEMESSFYRAYAHNKGFIDRVKERNAYAYSVASFVDDLYLDGKERENNKTQHEKLQEAYYTLVQGVKEEFLPYITQLCHDRGWTWKIAGNGRSRRVGHLVRLNGFIEYNVAVNYIEEVRYCASSLLNELDTYLIFRDYKNDFDSRRAYHGKQKCCVDSKTNSYYCLSNSVVKHETAEHPATKYDLSRNYTKYVDNSIDMMALTVFSLYFSGKHDDIVNAKGSKYKEAMATFHYTLKNLQGQPEFDENTQDDLNKKLNNHEYKDLFKEGKKEAKDTFTQDYEDLDVVAKYCAFAWKKDRTKHLNMFKTLIPEQESFEFYYDKTQLAPIDFSDLLLKKLTNPKLKDVLAKYIKITQSDKSLDLTETLLNIAYSLSASRTKFDIEATQTSPFNTGSALGKFIKELSLKLQGLETTTHESLYEKPIFKLYHENLHGLITHALIEGEFNALDFTNRKANANKLLSTVAPDTQKKYEEDLKELNDGSLSDDLKIKTEHEQLFEKLKALDGITSQIHAAEDKKQKLDDGLTSQTEEKRGWSKTIRNSKSYQVSISGLKGLSFFITLFTTGEALKTFKKQDLKALMDITTGINAISKTIATTAVKPLSQSGTAKLMVKSLFSDEAILQKAISKLAVPAIIVGSYYEIQALDDEDYDAMIGVSAKASIFVAIAVFASGTWVAVGIGLTIGVIIEALWYVYSKYLIDTRTEILIEKSLFYQGNGRKPYILESLSTGNETYIFNDKETPIDEIQRLGSLKATRDFIYTNYEKHSQALQTAISHEFNSYHIALQGVQVKKHRQDFNKVSYFPHEGYMLSMGDFVTINKSFYEKIEQAYLVIDGKSLDAKEIKFKEHTLDGKDYVIKLLEGLYSIPSQRWREVADKHTFHLLLSSDTISVKYKLDVVYSTMIKRFSGADKRTRELHVANVHSVPLLEDDLVVLS